MKHITYLILILCLFLAPAYATVKTLDALYFEQVGSKFTLQLECNWDGKIETVTVFGYYKKPDGGTYQEVITPNSIERFGGRAVGGGALLLDLPESMMTLNGMPLGYVEIDYQTHNRRCPAGFGTEQLVQPPRR